eukprot:1161157-Pelagomonas_calceolata.AAC.4
MLYLIPTYDSKDALCHFLHTPLLRCSACKPGLEKQQQVNTKTAAGKGGYGPKHVRNFVTQEACVGLCAERVRGWDGTSRCKTKVQ